MRLKPVRSPAPGSLPSSRARGRAPPPLARRHRGLSPAPALFRRKRRGLQTRGPESKTSSSRPRRTAPSRTGNIARPPSEPGGSVSAEGDLDFRGTLGVERTAPVGFRGDPAPLRARYRRAGGPAREPAEIDGALLRRIADIAHSAKTGGELRSNRLSSKPHARDLRFAAAAPQRIATDAEPSAILPGAFFRFCSVRRAIP
jgi:hypothetical protein